jgi:hypothetical protein
VTNIKCATCGFMNFPGDQACRQCGTALTIVREAIGHATPAMGQPSVGVAAPPSYQPAAYAKPPSSMTKTQGTVLIALISLLIILAFVGIGVTAASAYKAPVKYQYKVVRANSQSHDRTGEEAGKFSTIQIGQKDMDDLGADGWELVGSFLEMETAFPNFGNEKYVTGLQPNVRPQSAVLLFKKPIK